MPAEIGLYLVQSNPAIIEYVNPTNLFTTSIIWRISHYTEGGSGTFCTETIHQIASL